MIWANQLPASWQSWTSRCSSLPRSDTIPLKNITFMLFQTQRQSCGRAPADCLMAFQWFMVVAVPPSFVWRLRFMFLQIFGHISLYDGIMLMCYSTQHQLCSERQNGSFSHVPLTIVCSHTSKVPLKCSDSSEYWYIDVHHVFESRIWLGK